MDTLQSCWRHGVCTADDDAVAAGAMGRRQRQCRHHTGSAGSRLAKLRLARDSDVAKPARRTTIQALAVLSILNRCDLAADQPWHHDDRDDRDRTVRRALRSEEHTS